MPNHILRALTAVTTAAIVLAACSDPSSDNAESGAAEPTTPPPTALPISPTPTPDAARNIVYDVPDVDTSLASVELSDVIFDTFGRGPLDLSLASPEQRTALLDAIPPIDDPPYVDPATDPWLLPDDPVLGYVDGAGQAFASPHKILALHEIVNAVFDNRPVLISYCPLCDSGVVFSRVVTVDGVVTEIRFSNTSALFDNDLVMVDRQTGTYWWQVAGLGIVGALTDTELDVLPSTTMRWSQWLELHPDTLILSRDLGFGRDYTSDRFAAYATSVDQGFTPFPVREDALADPRLSPATRVVAVSGATQTIAVPVSETPVAAAFDLNGEPVVVLSTNGAGAAFSGVFEGAPTDIRVTAAGFTDSVSGVTFDLSGTSLEDPERALTALPSRSSFWFAIVAAFPEVTVVEAR